MVFAMRLAEIRTRKGLTQRALAEMIGMDAATVNRAESMAPSAKLETYRKCADALGVTLEEIFGHEREAIEDRLVEAFRQIDPWRREELLGLIELAASRPRPSE